MDASRDPAYLRYLIAAVATFRGNLVEFLDLHVENTGFGALARGVAPAVFPKDGADPKAIADLRAIVAETAGIAADAAEVTGVRYLFHGILHPINPIDNWDTMLQPKPLLEPENILSSCDRITGKLKSLLARAEAEAPVPIGVDAFHPLVWGAARRLWGDGHYRQAVSTAAEALVENVKSLTGRRDVPETSLWQQVFSNGRGEIMSVTKGLLVRFDALPGKEDDVKEFLDSGRALVEDEQATTAWFAIRLGPTSFGIFDVFPDDAGRDAHLSGPVAVALGEQTGTLFSEPTIEKLDVLGSKLPA